MEIPKVKINSAIVIAIVLIFAGVAMRLLPHLPNFAPVGAIALFGGAILGWRMAVWLPLAVMIASDFVIGFYPGIIFTWTGFLLIAVFGMILRNRGFLTRIGLGALGSAVIFFIVSNFGVWASGTLYPQTFAGLIECFYMAIPFFRMSLAADLFYSTVLFGSYALAMKFVPRFQTKNQFLPLP